MLMEVLQRWAPRYARIALAAAFLNAVAGRFGLWTGQVRWESFERFIARTAELNAWAPRFLVPVLAWSATIAETTLAVALINGRADYGILRRRLGSRDQEPVYTNHNPPLLAELNCPSL